MELLIDLPEVVICDVGIDLCRRDVAVPEQQLNGTQICAIAEERGRETVAQQMGGQVRNPGGMAIALEPPPELLARHRLPFWLEEEEVGRSIPEQLSANGPVAMKKLNRCSP